MTRRHITLGTVISLCLLLPGVATMARGNSHDPAEYIDESIPGADRPTPDLIRALGDADMEVRWRAAVALEKTGPAAVPLLIGALTDDNVYIRQGAALVLGDLGRRTDEVTAGLLKALSDPDAKVREHAAEALGKLGARDGGAIQALVAALADHDPFVVGKAAAALGKIGREAVPALIVALEDKNEHVREAATVAIGKMGADGRPALPALVNALKDGAADVRWGAVNDLGALGAQAKDAAPALLALLCDPDQDVRWAANLALRTIDPGTVDKTPDWRSTAAAIDSVAPELMKELHIPGASIALVDNRKLIWSRNFGIARVDQPVPVTDETLFEACSMTKPVFAYIALKLVEQGKLDLDRPLAEYLREPHIPNQEQRQRITARMVLSHTSGLPNWRKGEDELDGPLPVLFSPGSRFSYSGEGFYLLQRVVEHITGEPLEIYAGRTLLRPLGLKHTSFVWTEDVESQARRRPRRERRLLAKNEIHPCQRRLHPLYDRRGICRFPDRDHEDRPVGTAFFVAKVHQRNALTSGQARRQRTDRAARTGTGPGGLLGAGLVDQRDGGRPLLSSQRVEQVGFPLLLPVPYRPRFRDRHHDQQFQRLRLLDALDQPYRRLLREP